MESGFLDKVKHFFSFFLGGGSFPKAQRFRVTSCQVKEQTDPVFPTHNAVADDADHHDDDA